MIGRGRVEDAVGDINVTDADRAVAVGRVSAAVESILEKVIVVIVEVDVGGRGHLLEVAQARCFLCRLLGLGENRKENGGEDRDNRDDDEQFDQGEST